MARHAETSSSLALSRRPRDAARLLTPTAVATAAVLSRRPDQPAEIAQARVFERLLEAECAELQDLAHRIAEDEQHQPEPDDPARSSELTQLRARIAEVDGLLRALQGRFPRSA